MWKAERDARDKSRKNIEETRDMGIRHEECLLNLRKSFDKHIDDETSVFKEIFNKISELKCPKEETIELLEKHNKEQNGRLGRLADQGKATDEQLKKIIDQTKGADKEVEKEERRQEARTNNRRFYIALVACMLLGISVFTGLFVWYKGDNSENDILTKLVIEKLEEM